MTPALQLRVHCQVPSMVTVRPLTWTLTALSGFGRVGQHGRCQRQNQARGGEDRQAPLPECSLVHR